MAESLRDKVVACAKWGVENEPAIHYKETRPMPLSKKLPLTTDCSGFATLCYHDAGAPDPNGLNYDGTGYTGTLLDHGVEVPHPEPGDLVFYGPGTAYHVAVVVEAGADPLTVSHGEESGPEYVRVSQDNRQPVRFRSYLPAAIKPAAKPAPVAAPKRDPEPSLKVGASGPEVGELQAALNKHGAALRVDHQFGAHTLVAVRRFQASKKLAVDGVAGAHTWAELKK
jgi:hypothetical protein